jgi:DNA-binding transcriptional LysR family regulator
MSMPSERLIRRRLKLRDLDTLLAVAQWGSMAKAATHLSTSQPAISKAIADMEHVLGVRLLDRTSQGVEPNLYGRALLKRAVAVFDEISQGTKDIAFLADPTVGELRIGATEPMIAGILQAILDQLTRRHPRLSFNVIHLVSVAQQYQQLRDRQFDLILSRVFTSKDEDDLSTEVLFDDPLYVVAGVSNPWTRRRKIRLAQLANEPWTLPPPDTLIGAFVGETLRSNGLDTSKMGVVWSSVVMHTAMLATGRFLSTLSASVLQYSVNRRSIRVLPVGFPNRPSPVGIVTLKNRTISPVAQLFIECAREVARPLATGRPRTIG